MVSDLQRNHLMHSVEEAWIAETKVCSSAAPSAFADSSRGVSISTLLPKLFDVIGKLLIHQETALLRYEVAAP